MTKLKVAFCIPDMIVGGVESVLLRTLEELEKHDDIKISILMHKPLKEKIFIDWFNAHPNIKQYVYYPRFDFFEGIAQYTKIFPLKNIRKIIFSIYKKIRRRYISQIIASGKFDIFLDYKNFSFFKELRKARQPKITWVHGSINYFEENHFINHIQIYDKIVCLSDSFLKDFKKKHPESADKITRIYNPINFDEIKKISTQMPGHNGKYFLCVSRLSYDKDIETIIRAYNKFWINENAPEIQMVIVGDGPNAPQLKQLAASLPAGKNIVFPGCMPVPFGYMRGAMAHIMSSRNEGLPTVLIECASIGTLNVASNCKSGVSEILLNGKAGVLFKPGNDEELAKIMSDIWNNRLPVNDLINTATNNITRFATKDISDQILRLIYNFTKEGKHA